MRNHQPKDLDIFVVLFSSGTPKAMEEFLHGAKIDDPVQFALKNMSAGEDHRRVLLKQAAQVLHKDNGKQKERKKERLIMRSNHLHE